MKRIDTYVVTHPIELNSASADATVPWPASWPCDSARFQALVDLTGDWYWEQDSRYRFTHISESLSPQSTLQPADCLGHTRWELCYAGVTDAQWTYHRSQLDLHLSFQNFEIQRPTVDGGWLWASVSGVPVFDDAGVFQGYWGIGRDIGKSKHAEQNLRDSQSQYQELVQWAPVGLCVVQNGTIAYVNPAAMRIWGAKSSRELNGTAIEARLHPQFLSSGMQRIHKVLDHGGQAALRPSQHVRMDGRSIDVEDQAMPLIYQDVPSVLISFQDISARKQTETTLRDSEDRFRILTQLSSDWYWEQDHQHRFVMVNGAVASSTGLAVTDFLGKTHWELPTQNVSASDWDLHRGQLANEQEFRDFEIHWPDSAGRVRWSSVSGAPVYTSSGQLRGYRGVGRDVTAQKQAAEQIHRLAFYDALTGLPNRRLLQEQLKRSLHGHTRHRLRGALLFIDLDNFKSLNDTQGHDVGDALLQQVGARLATCVRDSDTVARLGGDEFVVVLGDLDEDVMDAASQAEAIGKKILTTLNVPYRLGGREHRSTPSIGITLIGVDQQSVDDLLKQADLAMYQAKASGRNTLRFFDVAMQSEVDSRVAMESDLRDGLQGGEELELLFQPIVDSHGAVAGAEALVRWLQPQRGLMMPADFIPLAEATGLILPLGRWVLDQACAQLALWSQDPALERLTLSVNVSARQLGEADFVQQVTASLQRHGAKAQRLRLELTETMLVHRVDDIILKMAALKAMGVGFSLDDFGTGYSSLSYLKKLPLDLLKIDQSFVRDVLTDTNDAAIARTIVALGQTLGLAVVAEGVETLAQRVFLADIGCTSYQGFLFSEPLPIGQFNDYVVQAAESTNALPSQPARLL